MRTRIEPSAFLTLIVWFLLTGLAPAPARAHSLAISRDGHQLYVADPTGGIEVIDTAANQVLTTLSILGPRWRGPLALSPDGRYL